MSIKTSRMIAAVCGVIGVLMLTAHFFIPAALPQDSAGLARISAFLREHHDSILISAWLQVAGGTLYVLFILAIVQLAGATTRFAGRVTTLAGTVLVSLTLVDTALVIAAVQAAAQGHTHTLRTSFDLVAGPNNDAVGRSFLIAPAILMPLGIVILQTRLMARSFGYVALAFGAASQVLGLVGLFSKVAFADINPAVLGLENLWLILIAITLVRTAREKPDLVPARTLSDATVS
jgi:hypothetical protein